MKKAFFIIVLLFAAAAVFEFHPAVEQGRYIIPAEVYGNQDCGCDCVLQSRPWYSTFNYWVWVWVLTVPVLVFFMKTNDPKWKKAVLLLAALLICYGAMNLSVHLMWDIRNVPFLSSSDPAIPDQETVHRADCFDTSDGARFAFALLFGWIPAGLYIALWFFIAKIYRRVT